MENHLQKNLILPENYSSSLDLRETEKAIRLIKEFFQTNLAFELNLMRVTAPRFVKSFTGINDDLNGIEEPVNFLMKDVNSERAEIVQSLAKWKRLALAQLKLESGEGIYTDMNAIRPDETLDNLHSLYVDQWDWERIITEEQRSVEFLEDVVKKIYSVIKRTEKYICYLYRDIEPILPEEITFYHTEELEELYPDLIPKEREKQICKKHGAVFITGIGHNLKNGHPHDGRAPDYDDWSTVTANGRSGLNGDIVLYYPVLDCAFELSSMGIRVDAEALNRQLQLTGAEARKGLYFHKKLLRNELPLSIGGGIGQSRLCMYYLRKAHIGEIQSSVWPENMLENCQTHNIHLL